MKIVHRNPSVFELRVMNKPQLRLLFFQISRRAFMICHVFLKKTKKIPKKEIDLAVKRTM
jgi:phage-related protein